MSEKLVLNREAILESLGGDEELFDEMAGMYIGECENYCQNLYEYASGNEADNLSREAHTLKSLFGAFADEDGRQLAILIEKEAKGGRIDQEKTQELVARARMLSEELQRCM